MNPVTTSAGSASTQVDDITGRQPAAWPVDPRRVTIAIEGWNAANLQRRDVFHRALNSLREQTYPVAGCEILVIVDANAKADFRWIEDILPGARILRLDTFTYYRCKNLAMRQAGGDYLVLADSDVEYDPRWLEHLLGAFAPGVDIVAGRTRYEPGLFSETMMVCDGGMFRGESGPTHGFFAHNVAMRASTYRHIRFDETLGKSGGGAVEQLRDLLHQRGIRTWFCCEACAQHHYPGFFKTRLRLGAYRYRTLRMFPAMRGAWLARVPLVGPVLVTAGALAKAWARAVRQRRYLPGGAARLPVFLVTVACVEAVDLLGACAYAWAPDIVQSKVDWFDVPMDTRAPSS